jgi:DsbC/DsbD-like thiol-disulfide interchange protein
MRGPRHLPAHHDPRGWRDRPLRRDREDLLLRREREGSAAAPASWGLPLRRDRGDRPAESWGLALRRDRGDRRLLPRGEDHRLPRRLAGLAAALVAALAELAAGASRPAAAAVASGWARNPQSQVRLVSGDLVAARRGELRLGLQFRLAPGWHVYWKNSGDAGFAPILTLTAPGLSGARLLWPAPHRFELPGDLEAFGYAGEVVYPVRASLAATGTAPLEVSADIDYLTCQIDCVPYRYRLSLAQPLGERPQPDPELGPLLARWWRELPVPAGSLPGVSTGGRLDASRPEAPVLEIAVSGVEVESPGGPDLFLEPNPELTAGRPEVRRTAHGVLFRVPVKTKVAGRPPPARTVFAWTVTGLARGGNPLAIEAQGVVTAAGGPAGGRPAGGAPERGARAGGRPPVVGPVAAALLGALALTAALAAWGMFAGSAEPGEGRERRGARGALPAALGFAALAAALAPLYLLALQVRPEGLAGIELLMLAMALLAWLRHRAARGRVKLLLTVGFVVCAAGLLWLADHGRSASTQTRGDPHAQHPHP